MKYNKYIILYLVPIKTIYANYIFCVLVIHNYKYTQEFII